MKYTMHIPAKGFDLISDIFTNVYNVECGIVGQREGFIAIDVLCSDRTDIMRMKLFELLAFLECMEKE